MMQRIRIAGPLLLVYALFLGVSVLHAASDSFQVSQSIVDPDNEPPTTPTNLTATPVAPTQIDLSWDTSSDNIYVNGYQVFRDAVQIATTSLTTYSDIGLTPSTTYSYNVTAFDTSFNFSTTSATTSTTTLPIPPPPPTPTSSTSSSATTFTQLLFIRNLSYDAAERSIDITFDTTRYARAIIRWGRTGSYEGGFTSSDIYRNNHRSVISGLDAGTVYEIEILVADQSGRYEDRETITVRTKAGPDIVPPTNATNFQARLSEETVTLSWENPVDSDFSYVRILSSDQFYPTHPADGWLVYEGRAQEAVDARKLADGQRRYYTIFAYDEAGNTSSGAVTSVTRGVYSTPTTAPDGVGPRADSGTSSSATSTADAIPRFDFDDLRFEQDGEERPSVGGEVALTATENTVIYVPYELLPEHLKTIVVTLTHPDDAQRVFSFLLRIDPEKEHYRAHIGPLHDPGVYATDIAVFDFATRELFTVSGSVVIERSPISAVLDTRQHPVLAGYLERYFVPGLLLLILFVLLLLRSYRRREPQSFTPRSLQ